MTRHPEPEAPWSVPVAVDDIPEAGLELTLIPDEGVRTALARLAGVRALPALAAEFRLVRLSGGRVAATGRVTGTVGQTCVVTLEPMESPLDEAVDLVFAPAAKDEETRHRHDAEADMDEAADESPAPDLPEPITQGRIDLGAVATEFLMLGINPYPRKPGVVFEPPVEAADPSAHPFAALAALRKPKPPGGGPA